MKKSIIAVLVIVVLGLIIWNVSKKGTLSPVDKEPIKIGAIISQTGVAASFGEMTKLGMDMAAEEINTKGGVNGRKVVILYENDNTDPKTAAGLYQKFTGIDKVDAIVGSNFDFVTQPVFALAKMGDTVVVSPSNPRIPGAFETNEQSFVMMSDFSKVIGEFEKYLAKEKYTNLAIVRFESAFGEEITKTLNTIQTKLGKPTVIDETYKQIGNNDFKTVILKLKQAKVDIVFLDMIATDPITFVTQAKQLGFTGKILTHIGIQTATAIPGTDPNIFNGMIVLNWDVVTSDFDAKFHAKYNKDPLNSVNRAYDEVFILAEAVSKAKTKAEVSKILEITEFTTPNGTFKFTADHSAANTPVRLEIFEKGKLIPYVAK